MTISTNETISFREMVRHLINAFAVIMMIFLITKTKSYEVSWSWSYLLPTSWLTKLNIFLGNIGTLILIIPLTIIGVSYLLPEIKGLRTVSSLMSAGFGIYFMIELFRNGGQFDNIKNMFFTIHYIPTLEQKVEFFISEWNKLLNSKTINTIARHDYLQSYFDSNINTGLKNQISATKMRFIPELVMNEFTKANQLFESSLQPSTFQVIKTWLSNNSNVLKIGACVVGVTLCTVLCAWYMNTGAQELIVSAGKDTASLIATNTEVITEKVKDIGTGIVEAMAPLYEQVDIQKTHIEKLAHGIAKIIAYLAKKNNMIAEEATEIFMRET